ncbi:MAG TPA: hypothetical protein VGZ47_07430 [Gemmataceae bacterium]|nr:hypothetical protein [Gemmataceae bacterium]
MPATPPSTTPQKMPTIGSNGTIISPARIGFDSEGPKNPFDLARRYEGRAFASPDYSKLAGQLFFVHTDGGVWVVRYAPISQEDRYGGSVVLARDIDMSKYEDGDLVSVQGEILANKVNLPLGGALYRAATVSLVEKGQ